MTGYLVAIALGLVVFLVLKFFISRPAVPVGDAFAAVKSGRAVLVDVREPREWRSGVAQPAELLPLSDLRGGRERWRPFLEKNRDKKLVLYCASGMRSAQAAAILRGEGFDAANLGGLSRWIDAGLPTRRPQ